MRGTIKHIVLIVLAAALVLFFLIPAVRRMEPHHDVPPPVAHDTTRGVPPPAASERPRVIDEREGTAAEWRPVVSWEGTGLKSTQRFTIIVNTWRIVWETEVSEKLGAGLFQIMVYDGQGTLRSVAATTTKTDQGETILSGPGTFTLAINTLQKWKVKIEEKG